MPAFTTVRGGAYFFLPGIKALRYLATLSEAPNALRRAQKDMQWEHKPGRRTYNQNHVARPYTPGKRRFSIYWTWSYPWEANRDPTDWTTAFRP